MRSLLKIGIIICLLCPHLVLAQSFSPSKLKTLLNSLTPLSIAEHLAFYELYPYSPEGQQALSKALSLLRTHTPPTPSTAYALTALINKQPMEETPELGEEHLSFLEQLGNGLTNRHLKGRYVNSEKEVLSLPPDEIDLARGLFLSQLGDNPEALHKIRIYESIIDLMALQILAKIGSLNLPPEKKIEAINEFIFEEMGFRFPPHSRYAKNIDIYTFLPSVLDSRRGVCLGVSILYLCIAQRLGLTLEMITPPGHIYVRYRDQTQEINIETTARGVHLDSEVYLGINTRSLQQRNIKEVIGLAHFNEAAVYWHTGDSKKAIESYLKAQKYLPQDPLLKELMAYNYLMTGDMEKGKELLNEVKNHLPDYAVYKETIAEDFLAGKADVEAIKAIYVSVDNNLESIEEKKEELEEIVKKFPLFRAGHFHLAIAWLQLQRDGEALEILKNYHKIEPNDPTAEYYLAVLHAQRLDFKSAWNHFHRVIKLVTARNHQPKSLKELRKQLLLCCPEPKQNRLKEIK